jgi:hypothetical protein
VAKEAVLASAKVGRTARVLELGPIAVFVDPADPDLHAALGRARPESDIDLGLFYSEAAPFSIQGIRELAEAVNDTPGQQTLNMRLVIKGSLWNQPVPLELLLSADVNVDTGQASVRDMRA